MTTNSVSINPNLSISVAKAAEIYGVSREDLKILNADGDEKITGKELQNFGINKYGGLKEYFNQKTGALTSAEKTTTNPFGSDLKNSFSANYNEGQLSPEVASDTVGKFLPRLYA